MIREFMRDSLLSLQLRITNPMDSKPEKSLDYINETVRAAWQKAMSR